MVARAKVMPPEVALLYAVHRRMRLALFGPQQFFCHSPLILTNDAGFLDHLTHPGHVGFNRGRKLLRRTADGL